MQLVLSNTDMYGETGNFGRMLYTRTVINPLVAVRRTYYDNAHCIGQGNRLR